MYISLMTAEPKQSLKESIMGPTSCETGEKKLVFSKQTWGKQSVQNIQEQISQVNPRIKFCIEQICDWSQNQNKLWQDTHKKQTKPQIFRQVSGQSTPLQPLVPIIINIQLSVSLKAKHSLEIQKYETSEQIRADSPFLLTPLSAVINKCSKWHLNQHSRLMCAVIGLGNQWMCPSIN